MVERGLGIEDEEFWTDPWRTRKVIQRQLMEKKEEAFLIDVPERVTLDSHDSLPLAILRVFRLGAPSHFARSAVVTAMNLYTGELSAELGFDAPAPGGPGPATDAMLGEAHLLDLAKKLNLPLARGDYLVTVLVLNKSSERRRMRVVESAAYEDPAVEEFLRVHMAARLGPPLVSPAPGSVPGSMLPLYEATDKSPALLPEPGIALAITRVNLLPATECEVYASYRLPVELHHQVPPASTPAEPRPPTAIVPITLLITGSVEAAPRMARLHVPCYQPLLAVDGQTIARGYFAVDLTKVAPIGPAAQTYFVYAFSGPVMSGPVPTAFVRFPPAP